MKRKRRVDPDMPVGRLRIVRDASLPPPEQIAEELKTARITILIDGKSLDFYRRIAKKTGGKYQRLIREVLKRYSDQHDREAA